MSFLTKPCGLIHRATDARLSDPKEALIGPCNFNASIHTLSYNGSAELGAVYMDLKGEGVAERRG